MLHDAVFEALQVGAVRELIGRIYAPGFGKREVAALALLVGPPPNSDAAALQIVEKAGRELALLVRPVAEKLGLQSARIAFAGSVLRAPRCAAPPKRSCKLLLPQLTLAEPQGDAAAAGAVLLARCKAEE